MAMNLEQIKEEISKLSQPDQRKIAQYLLTNELIEDLKKFKETLNTPCDKNLLLNLENDFGFKLPEYIAQIYEMYDGMRPDSTLPFRLMSLNEVREIRQSMEEWWEVDKDICLLWSDDEGNFAGLYLKGNLTDKICFINHDEVDFSPVFRNIFSFYKAVFIAESNKQDWHEMPTDYPVLIEDKDNPTHSEDFELARTFTHEYQTETNPDKKQIAAFNAMNLMPLSKANFIYFFAKSEDMWIQERACEILGKRKDENAVPILAKIARKDKHNSKIAAMSALRAIKTESAQLEITKLRQELGEEWTIYLKD